jgi:hypothetical protein
MYMYIYIYTYIYIYIYDISSLRVNTLADDGMTALKHVGAVLMLI